MASDAHGDDGGQVANVESSDAGADADASDQAAVPRCAPFARAVNCLTLVGVGRVTGLGAMVTEALALRRPSGLQVEIGPRFAVGLLALGLCESASVTAQRVRKRGVPTPLEWNRDDANPIVDPEPFGVDWL